MYYVIPRPMELVLEMRNGFQNVGEQVAVLKEIFHSLKFTPITAANYVPLHEQALSGIDLLDINSTVLLEKYRGNCSLLDFLDPLVEFLNNSYTEIQDTALYCPYASNLDDRDSRECGIRWGNLFRKLEACRTRLLFSLSRLEMSCSLPPEPGTEKEKNQAEKQNKQIAFFVAFLEPFSWYGALNKKEVARIVRFILQGTEDYIYKNISSCREDYQGNLFKHTSWKYIEEARAEAKKLHEKMKLKGK